MKFHRLIPLVILVLGVMVTTAMGAPFDVVIGDKDGFGFGASDNGTGVVWPGPGSSGSSFDGRDAAEIAATNGAQITDVYSAIFPGFGPNTSTTASVVFPALGTLTSGTTLTVAFGDFQASAFGPITVNFNGIPENWAFDDGFQVTNTRSFVLSAAELAAANAAGQFIINLDHNNSNDFIAFDWFELSSGAVPEPASMLLIGLGLLGLAGMKKKFKK